MLGPYDAKHGLGFRGDVAVIDVPALQWGIDVLSSLLIEISLRRLSHARTCLYPSRTEMSSPWRASAAMR